MIALLATAATLAATSPTLPPPPLSHEFDADMVIKPGADPAGCKTIQQRVKDDQVVYFERLHGRGRSAATWLVDRKVAGCGVTTPMGYHPIYLLPGAADNPPEGKEPKPAGALPNRR